MHLFLEVTSGPAVGRKLHLKGGQAAKVGRTEWADFAIHEDSSMADVHFQLECSGDRCEIRDLNTAGGTLLNGKPLTGSTPLTNGATIRAGQTTFVARMDETGLASAEAAPVVMSTSATASVVTAPVRPLDAVALCSKLTLSEVAQKIAAPQMPPAEFAERLLQQKSYPDALRVLAFSLSKPIAVLWAMAMVRSIDGAVHGASDDAALTAAESWAKSPTEELRRAAQIAANETKMQTAAGWVALAAFWSGGSLSAPDLPVVPPGETLTCQALTGALMLTVASPPVQQMTSRYEQFVRQGLTALQNPAKT